MYIYMYIYTLYIYIFFDFLISLIYFAKSLNTNLFFMLYLFISLGLVSNSDSFIGPVVLASFTFEKRSDIEFVT